MPNGKLAKGKARKGGPVCPTHGVPMILVCPKCGMAALGRAGGQARSRSLSAKERKAQAAHAARERWAKATPEERERMGRAMAEGRRKAQK